MQARHYDVILFDSIGTPYTGLTPREKGLGGSEYEAILLAEGLAGAGKSVLVLNAVGQAASVHGVDYAPHGSVAEGQVRCDVLVLQRYSSIPPIACRKLLVAASDVPGNAYDHLEPLFDGSRDATLVAVSDWQCALFPAHWRRVTIPNMLPDALYAHTATAAPRRFVYASAALKGLAATLAAWRELSASLAAAGEAPIELRVCTPGYDSVDQRELATAGVTFLGSLPFDRVVEEIAGAAGLFYVNTWSETFCIVAAMADALRRRTHILCASEPGALPDTVASPLVTSDRATFDADFRRALATPDDARWLGTQKDYRISTVMPRWLALLDAPAPTVSPARARICLSMIVKNEAKVIERCLATVKPWIDSWAVVDTGSTDGTQDIIRRFLADKPGELVEHPWVDFSTNRNQALDLARQHGDYALVIDADDIAQADPGFAWPRLTAAAYMLEVQDTGNTNYWRVACPRLDREWRWQGVLHEALCTPRPVPTPQLPGLRILRIFNDGARSQQSQEQKFLADAAVLRRALQDEPGNARYAFYLAQSLRDAGKLAEAADAYQARVALGGWVEEVYFAKLQIAALKERLNAPLADTVFAYLEAHDARPQRAEALCELARYLRLHKRYGAARDMASLAAAIPCPDDVLFLDRSVYAWRARDEWSVSAYWAGDKALSARLCRELLADPRLPADQRERVRTNLGFCEPA